MLKAETKLEVSMVRRDQKNNYLVCQVFQVRQVHQVDEFDGLLDELDELYNLINFIICQDEHEVTQSEFRFLTQSLEA